MDEYGELLSRLENYLLLEDVAEDNEVISAYTLYNLVNERFSELRKVVSADFFKDEINSNDNIKRKILRTFKDDVSLLDRLCASVMAGANKEKSNIVIFFYMKGTHMHYHLSLIKDRNDKEFYFEFPLNPNDKSAEFVSKYLKTIEEIFQILEEYVDLVDGQVGYLLDDNTYNPKMIPQVFSDSFLDVNLLINQGGGVEIKLIINKDKDLNNLYERDWYTRKTLASYVEEHKDEILKKIPIRVNELNHISKVIIEQKNKNKGKSLVRK